MTDLPIASKETVFDTPSYQYELKEQAFRKQAEDEWLLGGKIEGLTPDKQREMDAEVELRLALWRERNPKPECAPSTEEQRLYQLEWQRKNAERVTTLRATERERKMGLLRPLLLARPDLNLTMPGNLPWFELEPLLYQADLGRTELIEWVNAAVRGEEPYHSFFARIAAEKEAAQAKALESERRRNEQLQQIWTHHQKLEEAAAEAERAADALQKAFETTPTAELFVSAEVARQQAKNARTTATEYRATHSYAL